MQSDSTYRNALEAALTRVAALEASRVPCAACETRRRCYSLAWLIVSRLVLFAVVGGTTVFVAAVISVAVAFGGMSGWPGAQ